MLLKEGYYDFEGNTIEYFDGVAIDLDANEEIPVFILEELGTYIGKEL